MLDPRQEFPIPPEVLSSAAEAAMGPLRLLQRYHRHTVIGAERVPTDGPALIVTNHSLATYDGFLLALALYEFNGRAPTGLADDLLFELPLLRPLALGLGMLPASPANGSGCCVQGDWFISHLVGCERRSARVASATSCVGLNARVSCDSPCELGPR
jgi:1-acyl-sn-glycerol-3-phosphate acyltransferase